MIINIREFLKGKKKQHLESRLSTLKTEREAVRRAYEEQAATKGLSSNGKEILTAEEIAALLSSISPSGFIYRVDLQGANDAYRAINLGNYRTLVDKMGHMERESEFIKAMCLIDKCDEYSDFEYMARAFKFFEYVVRHNKTNSPAVTYARQFNIEVRRYLEELNLL
jgi:hypothetical protein